MQKNNRSTAVSLPNTAPPRRGDPGMGGQNLDIAVSVLLLPNLEDLEELDGFDPWRI